MDMPFPGEEVWLVNWVLEGGGALGSIPKKGSTYIHTLYRLDKLCSALVEVQLKTKPNEIKPSQFACTGHKIST